MTAENTLVELASESRAFQDGGEDLVALALRAAELAPKLCGDCVSYHAGWPAFRLLEPGGLDFDRPYLIRILRDLSRGKSAQRWLVAGMADTGLLSTLAHALGPERTDAVITLVDVCETPLALCREFGKRHGRHFRAIRADLGSFDPDEPQEFIFAHSVLSHLADGTRAALVARFRRWLAPGGCLVLCGRVSDLLHPQDVIGQATADQHAEIVARLRARGIADAAVLERMSANVLQYLRDRGARRGAYATATELRTLLASSGFTAVETLADYLPPRRHLRPSGRNERRVILLARTRPLTR